MIHLLCFVSGIAIGLGMAIVITFDDIGGDEK